MRVKPEAEAFLSDLARRLQFLVMDVENVQHHGLKCICRDESMMSSQQAAFIVTPCLDLIHHHCGMSSWQDYMGVQLTSLLAHQYHAPFEKMLPFDVTIY